VESDEREIAGDEVAQRDDLLRALTWGGFGVCVLTPIVSLVIDVPVPKFARDHFIADVASLIALLVPNDRTEDSTVTYNSALNVLDDEEFRTILNVALSGHFPDRHHFAHVEPHRSSPYNQSRRRLLCRSATIFTRR
jgi:hypothetical protein